MQQREQEVRQDDQQERSEHGEQDQPRDDLALPTALNLGVRILEVGAVLTEAGIGSIAALAQEVAAPLRW
ncbi:hypothetical protein [Corallococcus caeni]|uniref:Uncharacterized protein n=1 Tax=Corallococcus caeni TaxID=3082388 RepID=A0ABQ6QX45_9BACT|nr:hypothetical protein ASNO1_48510 [Corallococcus sp. NO1]